MRIDVEPVSYADAGTYLGNVGQAIDEALTTLSGALSGTGSMAGSDTGGQSFAEGYDAAAGPVISAGCTLATAFGNFATTVHAAAVNHARAEAASSKKPMPQQAASPVVVSSTLAAPPSAYGGDGGAPDWWHYISSHVEGLLWPDADTAKLRTAANAYTTAATTVDNYALSVSLAKDYLSAQDSPEVKTALAHLAELETGRVDLAKALHSLATECTGYADAVDKKHDEIWKLVKDTLRDLAITEGVLVLFSVVTAGATVAAGGVAAAAELANAGRLVVTALRGLETIAKLANTVVKALSITAGGIERIGLKFATSGEKVAATTAVKGAEDAGARAIADAGKDAAGQATKAAGEAGEDASAAARAAGDAKTCGDPVDVATGQVVMGFTDLELDGALPLVLTRQYRTGFRHGRFFGPHWASTLDEHVEVSDAGVALVRADASILVYPEAGIEPCLPVAGRSRWPLRLVEGTRQVVVVDPVAGTTATYDGVDERRWLVRVEDRAGRWVVIDRDETGVPLRVRHHGGYEVLVGTTGGLVTSLDVVTDDGPTRVRTFAHVDGELAQVWRGEATASAGLLLERGPDDLLAAWVDSTGVRYEYVYDERGRCIWQGSQGGVMQYAYRYEQDPETGRRSTVVTDSTWSVRRFDMDARSNVIREVDELGGVTEHGYDGYDRLVETCNAVGEITRWSYDDQSRVVAVTDPLKRRTEIDRDEDGVPVVVVDPAGGRTLREVDDRGELSLLMGPDGATTTWERVDGRSVVVTDPTGVRTRFELDAAGLPVLVLDALGHAVRVRRDAFGRVVEQVDELGRTTSFGYDVDGRLVRRAAPDGSVEEWTYDGEGNLVREVDASGRVRQYEYGPFDVLTARVEADGSRIELEYDTERRLVAVVDATGARWRYRRDAAGRVIEETDFDGRVTRYGHDGVGRVLDVTSPAGERSSFVHDRAGNLVVQDIGGRVTELEYDPLDRLVRARGADGVLERTLDPMGRVLAETVDGRTTRWTFDAAGRELERVLPSGIRSTWTYDAAGRPVGIDLAGRSLALDLDAAGRTVAHRFADGEIASGYDELGRLQRRSVTHGGPKEAWSVEYGYTPTGELLVARDSAAGTREYVLDVLGRIEQVRGGSTERYGYDLAGNLTHAQWGASDAASGEVQGERTYVGGVIRSAGRDRFEVDDAGRVTRRRRRLLSGGTKEWSFEWSAGDRLRQVVAPDGSTWRYAYDVLGRRTAKERVVAEEVVERVEFCWDGPTLVGQTRVAGASVESTAWVHEGWAPVAQLRASSVGAALDDVSQEWVDAKFAVIVTDLVGSPVRVLGEDGASLWAGTPSVWGVVDGVGSSVMPLRFPGQYADDESGLFYNLYRYYDPTTGRYVSPDPLGLAPAPNPYTYPSNPTTEIDPLGLAPCKLWKLTAEKAEAVRTHPKFGKFYLSTNSKGERLWWSVDNAGHGGSAFKVYREAGGRLEWFKDADKYGNFIAGKHKGPTGLTIKLKDLKR